MEQVLNMTCPGCGATVSIGQKTCEFCQNPIVISTFNSVYAMNPSEFKRYNDSYQAARNVAPDNKELATAVAFCYLKLKNYDKALPAFEQAIEDNFDNTEAFLYAAVCLLKGKKPFVQQRATIDKALEYIQAANMIHPLGIHYYFSAYIKYDYFKRKFLKVSPSYEEDLAMAMDLGVSDYDVQQLFMILNAENPL